MVLNLLFLPDTTGLDLKEQERRWTYIRQGHEHEYHGPAVHPNHLSWWERLCGKGKYYDAQLDYQQKVEDHRADWEAAMSKKGAKINVAEDFADSDETLLDGHVHAYFSRTSPMFRGKEQTAANKSDDTFALPAAAQEDKQ